MSRPDRDDEREARLLHEVAARAVRRLDILEWVILAATALLATVGGAVLALLLAEPLGVSFRVLWVVASLLLFVVPGAVALRRAKGTEARKKKRPSAENERFHV